MKIWLGKELVDTRFIVAIYPHLVPVYDLPNPPEYGDKDYYSYEHATVIQLIGKHFILTRYTVAELIILFKLKGIKKVENK